MVQASVYTYISDSTRQVGLGMVGGGGEYNLYDRLCHPSPILPSQVKIETGRQRLVPIPVLHSAYQTPPSRGSQ
jgi:hypothetical protein